MQKLVFETIVGSRAMGLAVEGSDTDIIRVVVHGPEEYLGLETYSEGYREVVGDSDITTFDIRQFGRMLIAGNPNALLPLFFAFDIKNPLPFVDDSFDFFVRYRRELIGTAAVKSFRGYSDRMMRDFEKNGDNKAAAIAIWLLCALYFIVKCGHLEDSSFYSFVALFLEVKKGNVDKTTVEELHKYFMELTELENLKTFGAIADYESIQRLVKREVVYTAKQCLNI